MTDYKNELIKIGQHEISIFDGTGITTVKNACLPPRDLSYQHEISSEQLHCYCC